MEKAKLDELLRKFPSVKKSDDGFTVITCPVRLTYCHLDEPQRPKNTNKELRYSVAAIIPAGADIAAIDAAAKAAWAANGIKGQPPARKPLKPQSKQFEKKADGFSETGFYFSAETKTVPQLINADLSAASVDKFYNGCWARLKIKADAYNIGDNNGVKFWLQTVQFLADDEMLKVGNAADGFEAHGPVGDSPAAMPNGAAAASW